MVLEQIFPDIGVYLQVARFFLVLAVGVVVTRVVLMPLVGRLTAKRSEDKVTIHTYSSLTGIIGLFLSFIVALQAAQFGGLVTVLGAITAALTVAVGFGMRDQISNLVGGFFIYTDAPFVKGDYIRVNESEGVVREINLRQTVINGGSSEKQVIPNSVLTLNPVRNFTRGNKTKITVPLKIEAEDAEELEQLALDVAKENEHALDQPEPDVAYLGLEESKLQMELRCWTKDSKDVKQVRDELLDQITGSATKKGIFAKEKE